VTLQLLEEAQRLCRAGRVDEAVARYRQVLDLAPDVAEVHNNLGVCLSQLGQHGEAETCFQEALRLDPAFAQAHINRGTLYRTQGTFERAAGCFRQALAADPDHALAHIHLGAVLVDQGRLDEAVAEYREALRRNPENAWAHNNLGIALSHQGKLEEALACYNQALGIEPDYPGAHLNRALIWLVQGKYAEAWPEYEWRFRANNAPLRSLAGQRWDGGDLEGKTVLLQAEQGLGDCLQFIRYAPLVQAKGGRVVVECPQALVQLLAACPGIDELVSQGSPLPPFDLCVPLVSLPGILKTTLDSVPAHVPYLFPDPERVKSWQRELSSCQGFRIGIAWQGNPHHRLDWQRSFPLALFAEIAQIEGVCLLSLQKGPGTEQLRELGARSEERGARHSDPLLLAPHSSPLTVPVLDLGTTLDEDTAPFLDTAAVMKSLDLVISPDSVLAHLAGALAVPVWIALPTPSEWRWLLDREDSPWYPSARLFRQATPGDWQSVFAAMAGEVRKIQIQKPADGGQGAAVSKNRNPSSLTPDP
jgi:Flp pilus assembly protein TadD